MGLKGGCGSGGCHAGITIIGGEIGMENEGQPATTMAGITFYQCNPEHAFFAPANMIIENSTDITIYGLKGEGKEHVVLAKNCDRILICGYGGNAAPLPGDALMRFEYVTNFSVIGACDNIQGLNDENSHFLSTQKGYFKGYYTGKDPRTWFFVAVKRLGDNRELRSAPLDRPLVFRMETSL